MSNEIEAETIRHLAKVRKPVSPEPIQLTVYSSKVPNLTLVDMPGQRPISHALLITPAQRLPSVVASPIIIHYFGADSRNMHSL